MLCNLHRHVASPNNECPMLYPEVAVSVFQAEIGQHASTSEGFLAWKESEQWLIAWHEKECVLDDLILHWWLWLQRYRSTTTMQRTLLEHSCRQASFLSFCLCGRPAIYTIYVPYISCIYSMYIYNYIHTWRAARNVKNAPTNNYEAHTESLRVCFTPSEMSSYLNQTSNIECKQNRCVSITRTGRE